MKNVSTILLGAALLTVVSCGKDSNSSSPKKKQTFEPIVTEEGHYQATLAPLNAHLAGDVNGTATVKVKGDSFTVEVKVNGAPASIAHVQNIHVAKECPTLSSDLNKDGVIDAVEGQKAYGKVIIPLDSELKTQVEANRHFPVASFSGDYFYRKSTSLGDMMKDLLAKDKNTNDNIIKLTNGLSLQGRQVVIYGVAADADIPESAATFKGQTKHSSLPIACGSLIKIAVAEEGTNTNGGKEE